MSNATEPANVWIFHGTGAHFASGVFTSRDHGLVWIARHRLTGILTEYPVGDGCYDIALRQGHFSPHTRPIMDHRHTSPASRPATPITYTSGTEQSTTTMGSPDLTGGHRCRWAAGDSQNQMTTSGRDADDPRALAAARNNAEWCDLVCRTHGAATAFHAHAWVTATRSPPAHPDAVTLHRSAAVDDLLTLIDRSTGCSVKDSFASLDLSGSGFEVLFDAEWIHRPATATATAGAGAGAGVGLGALSWKVVETVDELRVWAAAHGGGAVFHPALLHDPAVAVLSATDAAERLAAGVIGNRSRGVIGLSNLFTVSADPDEAWAGAVAALSRVFPGLPLVGYERGEDLAAAHRAGFTGVGRLRVWRNA